MSRVVDARECRICPWASFTSAPAIFNQTAWEVRRLRQLTQPSPHLPCVWLDEANENVIVAYWFAILNRLKDQVSRSVRLHSAIFPHRPTGLDSDRKDFESVNPLDNTAVYSNCGIGTLAFGSSPIATTVPLINCD